MKKKDKVYYARIIPDSCIYDVCELIIRTVENTYFVGIDKRDEHAYLLNNDEIGKTVFTDRKLALEKVQNSECNVKTIISDTYYEEY